MKDLKSTNWKEFIIGSLFNITRGKSVSKIKINKNLISSNGVEYVTRTKQNNGVEFFIINNGIFKKYKGNALTIGAETGESFYRQKEFITGNNINILRNNKLNNFNGLFIKKCLDLELKIKFNYGRGASINRLKKHLVKLPAKKGKPDWIFMENYIKLIYKKAETEYTKKPLIYKKYLLDIKRWKEFNITNLFYLTGSKTILKRDLESRYNAGIYPYITTKSINNGTAGHYNYFTEEGNVLTIDSATLGHCTYQEKNFSTSDHVEKLIPKFKLNKYIAIFIVQIMNEEKYRYNYGRKCSQDRLRMRSIRLPAKNGKPDWTFMENYIKSLSYSASL